MKKLKFLSVMLVFVIMLCSTFGCYIVKGQKMEDAKGTYLLTNYVIIDADTEENLDQLELKGMQVYLVVTGADKGYYVYKDNDTAAYYREVFMSYEYNEEDTSMVEYVIYRYYEYSGDEYKFGVSKNRLNFSKPILDTGCQKLNKLDGEKWNWTKESDAIDLSYAQEKLGELVPYAS